MIARLTARYREGLFVGLVVESALAGSAQKGVA